MGIRWTDEEHNFLAELVGSYPFREVVWRYQRQARIKKWTPRSFDAIRVRVLRHFKSRKSINSNFTCSTLAEILGYSRYRVSSWVRSGKLTVDKVGYLTKINEKNLLDFVEHYSDLLTEADEIGLTFLFGSKKAKEIKAQQSPNRKPRRVYCCQTGRIFPSIKAAARSSYMDPHTVRCRAKQKKGFEFV